MNGKKWIKIFVLSSVFFILMFPLSKIVYIDKSLIGLKSNDVVYFSDSIMKSTANCEKNKNGIDDIVRLNGINVININHSAFSPIVYSNYIKNLPKYSTAIIPINMGSFSEEWFDKPSYQFFNKRIASSILSLDLLSVYSLFFDSYRFNDDEYNNKKIIRDNNLLGTTYSISYTSKIDKDLYCNEKNFYTNIEYIDKLSKKYKYKYMYELNVNHKMFNYLFAIISYAKSHKINLIFYITPINIEYGKLIVGNSFFKRVKHNIKILENYFKKNDVEYLNLYDKLEGRYFNDHQYVSEHLDYIGRKYVADSVTKKLINK